MGSYMFTEDGFEDYVYWQSKDKKVVRKINELLRSIDREGPMEGIGHPERLKNRRSYSRKIDEANRLVYDVSGDVITIESCRGHYDD